jgi:hypothetical protein
MEIEDLGPLGGRTGENVLKNIGAKDPDCWIIVERNNATIHLEAVQRSLGLRGTGVP